MNRPREDYFAALAARLATILVPGTVTTFRGNSTSDGTPSVAQLKTCGRKILHWSDLPAELRPACFQEQSPGETWVQRKGLPPKVTLKAKWWLYAQTLSQQNPDAVPSQALNPLLDAICGALAVDDVTNNVCTLGGLVSHAWVEGDVEVTEGVMEDLTIVTIPVQMLVP